jgi:hypothetical protein
MLSGVLRSRGNTANIRTPLTRQWRSAHWETDYLSLDEAEAMNDCNDADQRKTDQRDGRSKEVREWLRLVLDLVKWIVSLLV